MGPLATQIVIALLNDVLRPYLIAAGLPHMRAEGKSTSSVAAL
jgi:hypothetical protein